MANATHQTLPSADFLPPRDAGRTFQHPETVADDMANTPDVDVAALRCEEWEAKAELEHALYERAYTSCDAVQVLGASWCSNADPPFNRAVVQVDYADAARRFCAVTLSMQ